MIMSIIRIRQHKIIQNKSLNPKMGTSLSQEESSLSESLQESYTLHQNQLLIEKKTKKVCTLHRMETKSQWQTSQIQHNIHLYRTTKCQSISKLRDFYELDNSGYCSDSVRFFLVFQGYSSPNVKQEYFYRRYNAHHFLSDEIQAILSAMLCGLRHYSLTFKRKSSNLSLESLVICPETNSLRLRDPWLLEQKKTSPSQSPVNFLALYPSPQKIQALTEPSIDYNEYKSDLFSIGIFGLQLLAMNFRDDLYLQKKYVDRNKIASSLAAIGGNGKLRDGLSILLSENPEERERIYQFWDIRCEKTYKLKTIHSHIEYPTNFVEQSRYKIPNPAANRNSVEIPRSVEISNRVAPLQVVSKSNTHQPTKLDFRPAPMPKQSQLKTSRMEPLNKPNTVVVQPLHQYHSQPAPKWKLAQEQELPPPPKKPAIIEGKLNMQHGPNTKIRFQMVAQNRVDMSNASSFKKINKQTSPAPAQPTQKLNTHSNIHSNSHSHAHSNVNVSRPSANNKSITSIEATKSLSVPKVNPDTISKSFQTPRFKSHSITDANVNARNHPYANTSVSFGYPNTSSFNFVSNPSTYNNHTAVPKMHEPTPITKNNATTKTEINPTQVPSNLPPPQTTTSSPSVVKSVLTSNPQIAFDSLKTADHQKNIDVVLSLPLSSLKTNLPLTVEEKSPIRGQKPSSGHFPGPANEHTTSLLHNHNNEAQLVNQYFTESPSRSIKQPQPQSPPPQSLGTNQALGFESITKPPSLSPSAPHSPDPLPYPSPQQIAVPFASMNQTSLPSTPPVPRYPNPTKYNSTIVEVNQQTPNPSSSSSSSSSPSSQQIQYIVEEYDTGSRYEGYKKRGLRHGRGKFYYQDGGYYDGEWKKNQMHGWGKLYYEGGQLAYEGEWAHDQFHGYGKVYNDNPVVLDAGFDYTNFDLLDDYWEYYEGMLSNDTKEGRGRIQLTNKELFEGDFHVDRIQGFGKFLRRDGTVVEGIWRDSRLIKALTPNDIYK